MPYRLKATQRSMRLLFLQDLPSIMSNIQMMINLADAEFKARTAKRGLWADPKATLPWEWRRLSKDEKARAKGITTSSSPDDEFDFSRTRPSSVGGNYRFAPPSNSGQKAAMSYWITTSSNKRHNPGCRWYANSKGRPGTATEGIACKICGR